MRRKHGVRRSRKSNYAPPMTRIRPAEGQGARHRPRGVRFTHACRRLVRVAHVAVHTPAARGQEDDPKEKRTRSSDSRRGQKELRKLQKEEAKKEAEKRKKEEKEREKERRRLEKIAEKEAKKTTMRIANEERMIMARPPTKR